MFLSRTVNKATRSSRKSTIEVSTALKPCFVNAKATLNNRSKFFRSHFNRKPTKQILIRRRKITEKRKAKNQESS